MDNDQLDAVFLKAAENGDWTEISRLLNDGIDVDKRLGYDTAFDGTVTALSKASEYGHLECVQKLIDSGAGRNDVNGRTEKYKYALEMAAVKGHVDCFRFLVENRLFKAVNNREQYQVFIDAARSREFDQIQKLLVGNVDKDILIGWKGNNLMSLLIVYGCPLSCLQVLIDQGVNVNGVDYNGFTPLMCAVLTENISQVRFLLGLGVNVNIGTVDSTSYYFEDGGTDQESDDGGYNNGTTALMYAGCFRNNESLRELLHYCSVNNVDIEHGANSGPWTVVDYAAFFGNTDSVSLLIKSGCRVGGYHQMSYMTIHHFAMENHRPDILELTMAADENIFDMLFERSEFCAYDVNCLRIILKYVNDSNQRQDYLMLLLGEALENGTADCFRLVLEQSPEIGSTHCPLGKTILLRLCLDKHKEKFDFLLKWGVDIHIQDDEGNTAVMSAAKNGAVKCLDTLISNEASVHMQNKKGETALMMACASGDFRCVDLLIKSGANVTAQNDNGCTAVAYVNCLKCLQELIYQGADIHVIDKHEKTSLMFACERGCKEVVEFLIKQGLDINAQDGTGKTALMFACEKGFEEVVVFLIKQGLDINAQDNTGKTAMMYAASGPFVSVHDMCYGVKRYENEKCLKLLLDEGADVDLKDKEGTTVLSIAICGTGQCVNVLLRSGKLLYDGVLKQEHKQAMSLLSDKRFNVKCIMSTMEFGIFEWDWCLLPHSLDQIAFAAVLCSFGPGKIKYNGLEISLLHLAFIKSDYDVILYLLAHRFLLPEDLKLFSPDSAILDYVQGGWRDQIILVVEKFKCEMPVSLKTLSFLAISASLSNVKFSSERTGKVDALPVSEDVKTSLKFQSDVCKFCMVNWNFHINIEKVFNSFNFRQDFSWDVDFVNKCPDSCIHCDGFGYNGRAW